MGYVRVSRLIAASAMLAVAGQVARAAPAEPLVIAQLQEPVLQVVAMRDPEADATSEQTRRFAKALDDAAMAQRQAVAQRCRSIETIPERGAAREAWEANCRYTRR
jgi:hypothetical protein